MKWSFLILVVTAGCAPPDRSGSITANLVAWDEGSASYQAQRISVEHLTSLRRLESADLVFQAHSAMYETGGPKSKTSVAVGDAFDFSWVEDDEGDVEPTELSSLLALTLYRNIDLSISSFREQGWQPDAQLHVLVDPRWDNLWLGDDRWEHTDNAAMGTIRGKRLFLAVPPALTPKLPLEANLGVVGHELGHWVVGQLTAVTPTVSSTQEFRSMNEGVADLFGFAVTGDPNFIQKSIDIDRDLSQPVDYTSAQYEALLASSDEDPHTHGSVMARALYETWPRAHATFSRDERYALLRAAMAALRTFDVNRDPMAQICGAVAAQLQPEQRQAACATFAHRLAPLFNQIAECQ